MKKIIFGIILLFVAGIAGAQTIVGGGIYQNTTWTLANSPYKMTGSIVVFPGVTLTIEPGVVVNVKESDIMNGEPAYYFEVRGALNMVGTPSQLITFKCDSFTTPVGAWNGFLIKNSQGGSINTDYVSISNTQIAFNWDAVIGYPLTFNDSYFAFNGYTISTGTGANLKNCTFYGNNSAISGWPDFQIINCIFDSNSAAISVYPNSFILDSCILKNNSLAINFASVPFNAMTIQHSTFTNNALACGNVGNGNVRFNSFINNGDAVSGGTNATIEENTFTGNAKAVITAMGAIVKNNIINQNTVGVQLGAMTFGQPAPTVIDNQICGNSLYNIENLTDLNLNIPTNCFCDTDEILLETKIYDGYDDITRGLISYAIYDSSCINILKYVSKFPTSITDSENGMESISLQPNPAVDLVQISNADKIEMINIYSTNGQLVSSVSPTNNTLDVSQLDKGIYQLQLIGEGKSILRRIVKM
ncbi:MAG: T9SS type A sorting domain-containing protein [Bacteroidetes bacterium]|nr:T9SS type A sorting domain-containing protein [Bacteroidota bacterium]